MQQSDFEKIGTELEHAQNMTILGCPSSFAPFRRYLFVDPIRSPRRFEILAVQFCVPQLRMVNSVPQKCEGREKTQGTTDNRVVFVPVLVHFGRFRGGYHESSLIGTLYIALYSKIGWCE